MKCRRPTCPNAGNPTHRGLCSKHHRLDRVRAGHRLGYAPIEPVIDHLLRLQRAGLSVACVSRCSGISSYAIHLILARKRERVRASTADAIVSVQMSDVFRSEDGDNVPSVGTVRRLRALHAIGYSGMDLAAEMGFSAVTVRDLLTGAKPLVRASTARRVTEVFASLEVHSRPRSRPAVRAINRAARLGWAVPFAWDLDSIDDPAARPRVPMLRSDSWLPEYERLHTKGYSKKKIAALMGIEETSLNSRLRRLSVA